MLVESFGTQTATLTTEHSLATPTTAKTRVLIVDLTNLVAGENTLLQIKGKVLTGGATVVIRYALYAGPLLEPHVQSPPVVLPFGGTFTLTQTGGTGRTFPWSVITLD